MEQKHIDEIDESFLGEEFIDEDYITIQADTKESKPVKKSSKKTATKKVEKIEELKEEIKEEILDEAEDYPEVTIIPVKEPKVEVKLEVKENSEPKVQDPWKEEEEESFLKDASTWKAITGIAVILLLLSIFTQGFNFSEQSDLKSLTLTEAEEKAVNYVNDNLLAPPFVAEVESSEDQGSLYKITLGVAGESVDSYITKDGKLFFPQGFDVEEVLFDELALDEAVNNEETVDDLDNADDLDAVQEELEDALDSIEVNGEVEEGVVLDDSVNDEVEGAVVEDLSSEGEVVLDEPVEDVVVPEEVVATGNTVSLNVNARKWLFEPRKLTVQNGDTVELTIVPSDLDFTFAVPEFGIEQQVSGRTVVKFTANKAGSYEFKCSSCEDRRGMAGIVVVE
ncbi:MAG: hypothetical protein ABIH82_03875, partial [Candidatus Woesearchaeota archaeon]